MDIEGISPILSLEDVQDLPIHTVDSTDSLSVDSGASHSLAPSLLPLPRPQGQRYPGPD